jgi:hypothetical protein
LACRAFGSRRMPQLLPVKTTEPALAHDKKELRSVLHIAGALRESK